MKLTKIISLITLFIFIQGCNAMKGKSDMDNMLRLMERGDPAQFEQVMYSFIESAKLGDVEKMVDLTSYVTIEKMGIEELKSHYAKDTIPVLRACVSISEGGAVIHINKSQSETGPGWAYKKTCTYGDNEQVILQFIILNENGRIGLTSFGQG
jgi:hypothetical protein